MATTDILMGTPTVILMDTTVILMGTTGIAGGINAICRRRNSAGYPGWMLKVQNADRLERLINQFG